MTVSKNLKKSKEDTETAELLEGLVQSMFHDLRSPLASALISLDSLSAKPGLALDDNRLSETSLYFARIKKSLRNVVTITDHLSLEFGTVFGSLKAMQKNSHWQVLSIKTGVQEALNAYPFNNDFEKDGVVQQDITDFNYLGDPFYTKHLVIALMKVLIKFIRENDNGQIIIGSEVDGSHGYLILSDNLGSSNAKEYQDLLKSNHYGYPSTEIALGVAMSKLIMTGYKGKLACEVSLGNYTRFVLAFPKI